MWLRQSGCSEHFSASQLVASSWGRKSRRVGQAVLPHSGGGRLPSPASLRVRKERSLGVSPRYVPPPAQSRQSWLSRCRRRQRARLRRYCACRPEPPWGWPVPVLASCKSRPAHPSRNTCATLGSSRFSLMSSSPPLAGCPLIAFQTLPTTQGSSEVLGAPGRWPSVQRTSDARPGLFFF